MGPVARKERESSHLCSELGVRLHEKSQRRERKGSEATSTAPARLAAPAFCSQLYSKLRSRLLVLQPAAMQRIFSILKRQCGLRPPLRKPFRIQRFQNPSPK